MSLALRAGGQAAADKPQKEREDVRPHVVGVRAETSEKEGVNGSWRISSAMRCLEWNVGAQVDVCTWMQANGPSAQLALMASAALLSTRAKSGSVSWSTTITCTAHLHLCQQHT